MSELVFVYGTLRPPRPDTPAEDTRYYPRIVDFIQKVSQAELQGAELFDLGSYPAARPGAGVVYGELLTLDATALPILDRIEGHPKFYQRQKTLVQTPDGPVEAWIYWAPPGLVANHLPLESGDWFHRAAQPALQDSTSQVEPDPVLVGLVRRFAESACSWLSSVRPDGRAHAAPVWHIWDKGRVYVITTARAVRVSNIQDNPSVVLSHPDPLDTVILEGWATVVPGMRPRLQPLFKVKYDWDITSSPEYDTVLEVTPTRLLAWGKHGEGRWSGAELFQVKLAWNTDP